MTGYSACLPAAHLTERQSNRVWLACMCGLAPVALAAALATGWLTLPKVLPSAAYLLVMLIAAPVIEEYVFRGRLQPWITTFIGDKVASTQACPALPAHAAAIVLTSLAFATLHWLASPMLAVWWVMLPSLALGVLQAKTGQWQFCAVLHSSFNAVWCVAIWSQVQ